MLKNTNYKFKTLFVCLSTELQRVETLETYYHLTNQHYYNMLGTYNVVIYMYIAITKTHFRFNLFILYKL